MGADEVKQYFLDRLDEVDLLNKAGSLLAFHCYGAIIDSVAFFAYGGMPDADQERLKTDGAFFKKFVGSYMTGYCAKLLYGTLRCGLLHACSFDEKLTVSEEVIDPDDATSLYVTHAGTFRGHTPKTFHQDGKVITLLHAEDIKEDIVAALEKAWENELVRQSAERASRHQRLVTGRKASGLLEVARHLRKKGVLPETTIISGG